MAILQNNDQNIKVQCSFAQNRLSHNDATCILYSSCSSIVKNVCLHNNDILLIVQSDIYLLKQHRILKIRINFNIYSTGVVLFQRSTSLTSFVFGRVISQIAALVFTFRTGLASNTADLIASTIESYTPNRQDNHNVKNQYKLNTSYTWDGNGLC